MRKKLTQSWGKIGHNSEAFLSPGAYSKFKEEAKTISDTKKKL